MSALDFIKACKNGRLQVAIDMASCFGINIHAGNDRAFWYACAYGHLKIVKWLMSLEGTHGPVNIHANNDAAFRWACSKGHLETARYIVGLDFWGHWPAEGLVLMQKWSVNRDAWMTCGAKLCKPV